LVSTIVWLIYILDEIMHGIIEEEEMDEEGSDGEGENDGAGDR
jgi:hypothetical protein